MNPEVYWDLKTMHLNAGQFLMASRVQPPWQIGLTEEQFRAWHEFREELHDFAEDIWNRYHIIDHSGRERL